MNRTFRRWLADDPSYLKALFVFWLLALPVVAVWGVLGVWLSTFLPPGFADNGAAIVIAAAGLGATWYIVMRRRG